VQSIIVLVPLAFAEPVLLPEAKVISPVVMAFTEIVLLGVAVNGISVVINI
jgi:hypothetical protein